MHLPTPPRADARSVIVGMSGGVDSAVTALLLLEAGFDVQGLFMSNWADDDAYCTAAADFQDARRVCEVLGIPLHRVSFAAEWRQYRGGGNAAGLAFMGLAIGTIGAIAAQQQRQDYYNNYGYGPGYYGGGPYYYGGGPYYGRRYYRPY